jgi:TIR domain
MSERILGGFWSYVRADDEHEKGRITRLRERLERSICFYSGLREFRIFLDRKDIGWGQNWASRLSDSLDDSLLLFPIVTPSYFSSQACREEALAFQKRQTRLGRDDLILPVYYLGAELMEHPDSGTFSPEERAVGNLLSSHQREDWRSLRTTEETDPGYAKAIERLAEQATKAIKRDLNEAKPPIVTGKSEATPPQQVGEDEGTSPVATAQSSSFSAGTTPGHVVTLTVNQMPGRAQFTKISDAVARAPGGARILVSPGHYLESVLIEKPLELVGDGPREDIVIEASGPEPLIFDTNIGIVRNFTLRQSRHEGSDYCVWIKQGRLELE